MQVEWLPISSLTQQENNPRTHTEEQISQVAASITEFGWTNPILIDKNKTIVAGHCRFLAAQRSNIEQVPVIRLENLTVAQIQAYVIADNKLAENAGWNMDLLQSCIASLKGIDFDLSLLGFDDKEMDRITRYISKTSGLTDPDDVPDVPENPVTLPGDLYTLGRHRVLCGDSTKQEDVQRLAGGGHC
jgi:ParB-like chromosome segregation protein Spo0J